MTDRVATLTRYSVQNSSVAGQTEGSQWVLRAGRPPPAVRLRLLQPVAFPVARGDVRGVLVPVPDAGIAVEVLGRIAGVDRVADPADRERLVHERAVRAVEGEAGAAVAPVVRLFCDAVAVWPFVGAHAPQPLPRAARVHREGELLVVLADRERTRVRAGRAARMCAPVGGQGADHPAAVLLRDRLGVRAPSALEA